MYGKPAPVSKWYRQRKREQRKTDYEAVYRPFTGELFVDFGEWIGDKRERLDRLVIR